MGGDSALIQEKVIELPSFAMACRPFLGKSRCLTPCPLAAGMERPRRQTRPFQSREFTVPDPDGYVVGIGDRSKGWLAVSGLK